MCWKQRSGVEREAGMYSSCVVVGTAGLFDLLCSGVTGLWQTGNLVQAQAGWTHMVSSESVREGTCYGAKNTSTKCWNSSAQTWSTRIKKHCLGSVWNILVLQKDWIKKTRQFLKKIYDSQLVWRHIWHFPNYPDVVGSTHNHFIQTVIVAVHLEESSTSIEDDYLIPNNPRAKCSPLLCWPFPQQQPARLQRSQIGSGLCIYMKKVKT